MEPKIGGPIPGRHRAAADSAPSMADNIRAMWRFRGYFAPFLIPAAGLLLLALAQATLMVESTTAGGLLFERIREMADARSVADSGFGAATAAVPGPGSAPSTRTLWLNLHESPRRIVLAMVLFLILAQVVGIVAEQIRHRVNERFRFRLHERMLAALAWEMASTRTKRESGVTAEIFNNDVSGLAALLVFGAIGLLESVAHIGTYVLKLAAINSGIYVLLLLVPTTILLQGGLTKLFLRRESRMIEANQRMMLQLRARTVQLLENLGRLVYVRGERNEAKRVLDLSLAVSEEGRKQQLVGTVRSTLSDLVTTLSLPLIALLLIMVVTAPVTGGDLFQAQALMLLVAGGIASLASFPPMVAQYGPGLRRLQEVLDTPEPEPEPPQLATLRGSATPPAISLRGISFRYPGTSVPLLRDIDIEIPAGARIGIVGRSGCGKSTLARLLVGDVRPESGRLRVGGVDVTEWHLWWRREVIGFLPAEQGFLRGSLEENVLFGRSAESVRHLDRAIELSGVAAIAREKQADGGLRFQLHNPLEQLSSGQRRRVGIARLLAGDQPVWIFDEPGSQLDPQAMMEIAEAIATAARGRTALIITHDPDVFATDFNVFLRDGRVDDVATHEELLRRNEQYFQLVNKNVTDRHERGTGGPAAMSHLELPRVGGRTKSKVPMSMPPDFPVGS